MLTLAVVFTAGCKKSENIENPEEPNENVKVTTYDPQDITLNSAKCGGDAVVAQGLSLTEIGVCWSKEVNPTAEDEHKSSSNWNEPFVCTIDGLSSGTIYHVRAFALRGLIYYYGEDKSFTTEEYAGAGDGIVDGHDYIDLGLPSGILWATYNAGAEHLGTSLPENYGGSYMQGNFSSLPNWSGWNEPTAENWEELCQNTNSSWSVRNGINGWLFTASNGKSLFLPAADAGNQSGHYWSSTIAPYLNYYGVWDESEAKGFKFDSDGYEIINMFRGEGHSVRPVHSAK